MSLIQSSKSQSELFEYFQCLILRNFSFFLDILCQCATIAKLINQVIIISRAQHLDELDDVWMRYFAENGYLVIGKLCQFGCLLELIGVHHFHRIELLGYFVLCSIDVAVLP